MCCAILYEIMRCQTGDSETLRKKENLFLSSYFNMKKLQAWKSNLYSVLQNIQALAMFIHQNPLNAPTNSFDRYQIFLLRINNKCYTFFRFRHKISYISIKWDTKRNILPFLGCWSCPTLTVFRFLQKLKYSPTLVTLSIITTA